MLKSIIIGSILVAAVLAIDIIDLNQLEYGSPVHRVQSLPYPYQENREKHTVVEPYYTNYGYDYDTVLPAPVVPNAVALPKLGLIATVASYAFSVTKSAIVFLFGNGIALMLGIAATFGLCQLTPICSKLSSIQTLLDAQREFRSLATPERIAGATEFVQTAIRKYRSLQNE